MPCKISAVSMMYVLPLSFPLDIIPTFEKKNVYIEYLCKNLSHVTKITCPFDFFLLTNICCATFRGPAPYASKLRHDTFVTRAKNRVCHDLTPSIILPSITIPSSRLLPFEAIFLNQTGASIARNVFYSRKKN